MNTPMNSLDNKKYQFNLPSALVASFDAVAVEQHRTRSDALREAMRVYIELHHQRKQRLLAEQDAENDDDYYDDDEEEDEDEYDDE